MSGDLTERIVEEVHCAADPASRAAAVQAIRPEELAVFLHRSLVVPDGAEPAAIGLPASPGAGSGRIALSADTAMAMADQGYDVVLVRTETSPDDVHGMLASRAILTSRGGLASHAAVVARGRGLPAVVGATDVHVEGSTVRIGVRTFSEGDEITVDGSTGSVYAGTLHTSGAEAPPELDTLLAWADDIARGHVQIRVNADTRDDATQGRTRGAQGIGLCRTEHMFLAADRLPLMRRFILADDPATEAAALAALEAAQVTDFVDVLEAMDGLPVTVRLLDPPLHEFLPDLFDLTAREARGELSAEETAELAVARRLHESNPMIGTRGVRLGVVRPGLYEMQVRALTRAAADLLERGRRPRVEIMIPLVVEAEELRLARRWVTGVLDEVGHPELASSVVTVGVMIETPRAALTAGALAAHADFFSFGTNDLTQTTFAFSRDDVEARLLPAYLAHGVLTDNPFAVLDSVGVGQLVRLACDSARAAVPGIKLGVCGEHAGDPSSVAFLVAAGVDSLSCSPYRVPLARLAVAQALLDQGRVDVAAVTFTEPNGGATPSTSVRDAPTVTTTPVPEIDDALVLHLLRIRGLVSPAAFEASLGSHPTDILGRLVEAELVRHVPTRDLYGLLPPGRQRWESLLDTIAPLDRAAALSPHYESFLALNTELKELCTAWQVRGDEPNDHTDTDYDTACVARLADLSSRTSPVIESMAAVIPRLARYAHRLVAAADSVAAGDTRQFTGVMCESFHDIWMELHEDLIVLQRIDRAAEGSF